MISYDVVSLTSLCLFVETVGDGAESERKENSDESLHYGRCMSLVFANFSNEFFTELASYSLSLYARICSKRQEMCETVGHGVGEGT